MPLPGEGQGSEAVAGVDSLGSLTALLERAGEAWPGRPMLTHQGTTHTFGAFVARSHAIAAGLARLRVRSGDRVAIAANDVAAAIAAVFGTVRLGAVAVLINSHAPDYRMSRILRDCSPTAVVSQPKSPLGMVAHRLGCGILDPADDMAGAVRWTALADGTDQHAAACIIYTSGSSGGPQGVVVSHKNVLFTTSAIASRLDIQLDDTIGCLLPPEFDYGLYQIFLALESGAHVVWGGADEAGPGLLKFLGSNGVTVLPSVPALARGLVLLSQRRPRSLPPLRMITNTAEPMSARLLAELSAAYPAAGVYLMFGLTECKRVSILLPSELAQRPTSVGRPLDGTRCSIVDATTAAVPAGTVGELVVGGPHVALGYWGREPDPVRFHRSPSDGERLLFTGDQCWLDEEGYLYFTGRLDDLYKSHGYRVSAAEVALTAEDIPGVTESHCLPPVSDGDEAVLLAVTSLSAWQLRKELMARLEPHQIPGTIIPVDRLPRTGNGKVDRAALRNAYQAAR
jgi:acyl-CoA synthetase (AMP-forming)/AMP-acid ligase II